MWLPCPLVSPPLVRGKLSVCGPTLLTRSSHSRLPLEHSSSDLVSGLRRYLRCATVGPVHDSSRLQQLLHKHLDLADDVFSKLWSSCTPWQTLVAESEDLSDVESTLKRLLDFYSPSQATKLLTTQPLLLTSPVVSWLDFLEEYGFSHQQIQNIVSTFPELLAKSSLATAGAAIIRLKELGFDNDEVRHRVIAYCPQVLMMQPEDIDLLIRLWSKFKTGVDNDIMDS